MAPAACPMRSAGTPEMSRFCQTVRRISPSPRSRAIAGEPAHLRDRELAHRQHHPDPIEPVLLLRVHPDMGGPVEGRARLQGVDLDARQRAAELLLHQSEELLHAEAVEHVFEPRFEPVGAITVIDEDPHHRIRHRVASAGFTTTPVSRPKSLCPVMPPSNKRNQTPGASPKPSFTATAWKPISLVSSSTGMMPPPSNPTLNLRGRP